MEAAARPLFSPTQKCVCMTTNLVGCFGAILELLEDVFLVGGSLGLTGFVIFMGVYSAIRKGL